MRIRPDGVFINKPENVGSIEETFVIDLVFSQNTKTYLPKALEVFCLCLKVSALKKEKKQDLKGQ